MSNRLARLGLVLVIAFAMALGPLLPHGSPGGPAAIAATMSAPAIATSADYGHDHGDGQAEHHAANPSHGHTGTDHSHETPVAPDTIASPLPPAAADWAMTAGDTACRLACGRLERPPRRHAIA